MNIDNLCGFNKSHFFEMFGLFVREKRSQFKYSQNFFAQYLGKDISFVEQLEMGRIPLNQEEFLEILNFLSISVYEVLELSRITQVQYFMDVLKEINENFPRP